MSQQLVALVLIVSQLVWACSPRLPGRAGTGTTGTAALHAEPPNSPPPATAGGTTGCYYVWGTRELPILSQMLQSRLAAADSLIRTSAYAFGEECRHEDGTTTFLTMQTDFRVRIPVDSLTDEAAMGDRIGRVMAQIGSLPVDEVPGSRPGRVEFEFFVGEIQSMRLNIERSRYDTEAPGLEGADLFEHFRAP